MTTHIIALILFVANVVLGIRGILLLTKKPSSGHLLVAVGMLCGFLSVCLLPNKSNWILMIFAVGFMGNLFFALLQYYFVRKEKKMQKQIEEEIKRRNQ